ncbi:MAG: RDD family protein [Luteimonas sp.]
MLPDLAASHAAAHTPAAFWRRYAAYSLDFTLIGGITTLLVWPRLGAGAIETSQAMSQLSVLLNRTLADVMAQGASATSTSSGLLTDPAIQAAADAVQSGIVHMLLPWLLTYAVLAAMYHIGFERSRWLGSPGKHLLGLTVANARDDTQPSLLQTGVRHFAGALSWLLLNLGHALAAVPPQKRALHDYIAGARVLSRDEKSLPAWARAWLALQVIAGVAVPVWMLLRVVASLQPALD